MHMHPKLNIETDESSPLMSGSFTEKLLFFPFQFLGVTLNLIQVCIIAILILQTNDLILHLIEKYGVTPEARVLIILGLIAFAILLAAVTKCYDGKKEVYTKMISRSHEQKKRKVLSLV